MKSGKNPKWVMCGLCADVLYGGPGIHPIERACECGATVVLPRLDKGYVRWDAERYKAAGLSEPEVEWTEEQLDPHAILKPERVRTIDDAASNAAAQVFNPDGTLRRG